MRHGPPVSRKRVLTGQERKGGGSPNTPSCLEQAWENQRWRASFCPDCKGKRNVSVSRFVKYSLR